MNHNIDICNLISSLSTDWKTILNQIYQSDIDNILLIRINNIIKSGKINVYPPPPLIFHTFNHFNIDKLKVVILGQDPYHQKGQGMGLGFFCI